MSDVGLVGRDRELARLRRSAAAASAGQGSVLLVAGEPGIGKTAVVARFAGELAGVPVLTGRSVADGAAPALWPWRRLLDDAGSAFANPASANPASANPASANSASANPASANPASANPASANPAAAGASSGGSASATGASSAGVAGLGPELLAVAVDPAVDPAAARFQIADRVARALRAAAEPGGLVVVLEDLHWADEASLVVLRHLCGEAIGSRLLVVGTYRDGAGRPPVLAEICATSAVETLRLGPLTVPDVAAYLAGLGPTHPSWAEHVHRRSGGNPLYVRELARVLAQDGLLAEPARDLPLPTELGRLVDYRLRRLSPPCYALLGVCSALGDELDPALLSTLTSGVDHAARAEAVRAGVLVDGDRLRFSHVVVREARYAELTRPERTALHRAIADALETHGTAADVAYHRLRAADDAPSRALAAHACRAAGQAATRGRALDDAHTWYEQSLALGQPADAGWLVEAAAAAYGAGLVDDALRRCAEAADLAEATGRAELLAAAALVVRGIGSPPPNAVIVELCARALARLPDDDVATRAQLLAQQAFATTETSGIPPAVPLSVEALRLAERCGEPTALIAALHARHQVLLFPDAVAERLALGSRLRRLATRVERPDAQLWSHMWRVEAHLQLGALTELDAELEDLAALAERIDWPITRWYLMRAQASRAVLIGRFADALELIERSRDVGLRSQLPVALPLYWSQLQDVLRLTGRFGELDPDVPVVAGHSPLPLAWALFARFLWEAGDRDAAQALYDRVRAALPNLRPDSLRIPTISIAAETAAASGDAESAGFCYAELLPYAHFYLYSASGNYGATARLLGALALALGRIDDADRHCADAVAMERRIGTLPFLVLAQLDHAGILLARDRPGDRDRAARLVERAAHTAGRLGMAPASARAAELSGALAAATAGGEQPLTAREREIAELVATGLANRAIAERLVLSERTVESHVRSILTKLQLANRTQVAAWASRRT